MSDKDSSVEGLGSVAVLLISLLRACLSARVRQNLRRRWVVESERQTPWNAGFLGDVLEAELDRLTPAFSIEPASWRHSAETMLTQNQAILAVPRADDATTRQLLVGANCRRQARPVRFHGCR